MKNHLVTRPSLRVLARLDKSRVLNRAGRVESSADVVFCAYLPGATRAGAYFAQRLPKYKCRSERIIPRRTL